MAKKIINIFICFSCVFLTQKTSHSFYTSKAYPSLSLNKMGQEELPNRAKERSSNKHSESKESEKDNSDIEDEFFEIVFISPLNSAQIRMVLFSNYNQNIRNSRLSIWRPPQNLFI